MRVVRARTPQLLEIADQYRLAPLHRRSAEDAVGELQRGTEARRAGADMCRSDRGFETAPIRGGPHVLLGVSAEEHERCAVVRAEPAHGLARGVLGALPVVAVSHARGLIE